MYESFYGLREKPFRIVPNPEYLYLSPKHQNALTYLEYGLMEDTGFILLTGEVGTGKTTLIRHILNQFTSEIEVAVVFNTNVSSDQLLNLILQSYGLSSETKDKANAISILNKFLIEKYAENKRVLLIIDEAQNLPDEAMEEVRMLSNLQSDDQILLQIMLAGQPELKAKLKHPNLAPIAQRISVNYHLSALTRKETGRYIAFRLKKAGGKPGLFSAKAVDMVYRVSGGIPRSINLMCDAALVYGFGYELKVIGVTVVEQVIKDRGEFTTGEPKKGRGGLDKELVVGGNAKFPLSDLDGESGQGILDRLQWLEAVVQKLHLQVEWQMEELERRAEGFKDELVGKLKELLIKERKRSDLLLGRYNRLREQYKVLEKKVLLTQNQARIKQKGKKGSEVRGRMSEARKR